MKPNFLSFHLKRPSSAPLVPVDLDTKDAVLWAQTLPQDSQLSIDCGRLRCQRTLGVGYVVSQLLLLRRTGANIWLQNVNGPLRRCLSLLQLERVFILGDAR
jgi:anti-anti-sigma regulatory factor